MKFTEALEKLFEDKKLIFTNGDYSMKWHNGRLTFFNHDTNEPLNDSYVSATDLQSDWKISNPKPKYKFWEVVKMLSEDNTKKFMRKNVFSDAIEIKIYIAKNGLLETYSIGKLINLKSAAIGESDIKGEWEEIE